MQSNFEFLKARFPKLFKIANLSEQYLYSDSNGCLYKIGVFAESMVNIMFKLNNLVAPEFDDTFANRIKTLKYARLLPREIADILYVLRKTRNDAVHSNYDDLEKAKELLGLAYTFAVWFTQSYFDSSFQAPIFQLPEENSQAYKRSPFEENDFEKQIDTEISTIKPDHITAKTRIKNIDLATSHIKFTEEQTRYLIDEQLRQIGWEVDSQALRYSKGTRPQKGRNLIIAEWPTNSSTHTKGFVDYAFFIGEKLYAILEAKKFSTDIPSVLDVQCVDYAQNIKEEHAMHQLGTWGAYKVPFILSSNGRDYIEQYKTKSGIWFRDVRLNTNIAKALHAHLSPQAMLDLYNKDIQASDRALENLSKDLLQDKDGLNLRYYQVEAIEAVENAIINGAETALLAMATGTGKTRTVLGMIYRFLKTKRFYRILFLVDRNALGEQAEESFCDVKIEDMLSLDDIYNSTKLKDKDIESETRFQVATVQSMVRRILYSDGKTMPSAGDYDLIIVDEAHRGYILDKNMTEEETLYRDQRDFLSKYKKVLDYFNAIKIALTATPALHTSEIFGNPVYTYSYRKAVIDGYLIDHDAPHRIKTKLSEEGIKYQKGETVALYNPITNELLNSAELEDELNFNIEHFNKQVVSEEFNRTVLEEIAYELNPEGEAKTLIYAVDDKHADIIVRILREIYAKQDIVQDAIVKITGKSAEGDQARILTLIKAFKNETFPNIAVTVDLLTTGIDVPTISNLVFMRRVKSRILFEQMIGRATRLCPEIGKSQFEIFDPVGVYESIEDKNTKPVVANPTTSIQNILDGLALAETPDNIQFQKDMLLAKLLRKTRSMSQEEANTFNKLTGKSTQDFINSVRQNPFDSQEEVRKFIQTQQAQFTYLDNIKKEKQNLIVISEQKDQLRSHERTYGDFERPEDYLESFKSYLMENMDKIEALKLICQKPSHLTWQALNNLKMTLDENQFTHTLLNTAWSEAKQEDKVVDIIGFIRSQVLGVPLLSRQERVQYALLKLKKSHKFSKAELDWLKHIETYLINQEILEVATFDQGQFKDSGGFNRIDKIFNAKLREYISEINTYLYEEKDVA